MVIQFQPQLMGPLDDITPQLAHRPAHLTKLRV